MKYLRYVIIAIVIVSTDFLESIFPSKTVSRVSEYSG